MEGSLSARWLTSLVPVKRYDHVAKSDLRNNFAKDALNSPTVVKVFENKFGLFVWFRESNAIYTFERMFGLRS